jgi:hypothetical protein
VLSERLDICGLFALRPRLHVEAHFLVFLQRFEAAALDLRKLREQGSSGPVRHDETKTLRVVEPLRSTRLHHLIPKRLKIRTDPAKQILETRLRRRRALADSLRKAIARFRRKF